jgi:hypothetical protein
MEAFSIVFILTTLIAGLDRLGEYDSLEGKNDLLWI